MGLWEEGKYNFNPKKADSTWTETADGLRAQRVVLGEPLSGSTPGTFILMAYDSSGTPRRVLTTEDPRNPGFYRLVTDTELEIGELTVSGNFVVGNMCRVTSSYPTLTDGASGSFYTDLAGNLKVFDVGTLNRVNNEIRNEPIPPPEVVAGGITITSAYISNSVQLTSTSSTLKEGVWMTIDPSTPDPPDEIKIELVGVHYTSTVGSIINTTTGSLLAGRALIRTNHLSNSVNNEIFVPIDDCSKLYLAGVRKYDDGGCSGSIRVLWQGV